MLFGVLFEVLVMGRQVLFRDAVWGGALQAVRLEVLVCNRWMVCSTLVYCCLRRGPFGVALKGTHKDNQHFGGMKRNKNKWSG